VPALQCFHPFLLGFSALALVFFGGLFVKAPLFDLPEKSFFLKLTFQGFQRLFYVIAENFNIQDLLSPSSSRPSATAESTSATAAAESTSATAAAKTAFFPRLLGFCLCYGDRPFHERCAVQRFNRLCGIFFCRHFDKAEPFGFSAELVSDDLDGFHFPAL
jgi:hypothetical protein